MNAKELGAQPVAPKFASIGDKSVSHGGLTKRELFAAMAMQGLLASNSVKDDDATKFAADSLVCARALLVQLAKDHP